MRDSRIPMIALALLLAAGCKNDQRPASASGDRAANVAQASSMTPEELGKLGAQIKKQPNNADKLLAEHGLNEQSFAMAIRKVSEDAGAARRYTTAYKSAS